MKKRRKVSKDNGLIDAYKRVRKPTAPPGQVLPDKRTKLDEYKENEEYEEYEEAKTSGLNENMARANVLISGHVQGVFFRGAAVEKAIAAGLTGWVRNRVDGRVEAVLEGNEEAIRRTIDWLNVGPPAARVENVEVFWETATGEFNGFEPKHTF